MEGSDDFYLFIRPGWLSWSIWSSLKAEKVFIASGSAGQPCPAHPRNAFNTNPSDGSKDWKFSTAPGNTVESWNAGEYAEANGEVVIYCSTHDNLSSNLKESKIVM